MYHLLLNWNVFSETGKLLGTTRHKTCHRASRTKLFLKQICAVTNTELLTLSLLITSILYESTFSIICNIKKTSKLTKQKKIIQKDSTASSNKKIQHYNKIIYT